MAVYFPILNHKEQQEAAERIQELMRSGVSSAEAISCVAEEIRCKYQNQLIDDSSDETD